MTDIKTESKAARNQSLAPAIALMFILGCVLMVCTLFILIEVMDDAGGASGNGRMRYTVFERSMHVLSYVGIATFAIAGIIFVLKKTSRSNR